MRNFVCCVVLVLFTFHVNCQLPTNHFVGGVFYPDFMDKEGIASINLGLKWFNTCETTNTDNNVRLNFQAPVPLTGATPIFYSQDLIDGTVEILFGGSEADDWIIESKVAHYVKGAAADASPVGFSITAYSIDEDLYLTIESFVWTLTRITPVTIGSPPRVFNTGDTVASGYLFNCEVPGNIAKDAEGCPQYPCDANCNVGGRNAVSDNCGDFYGNYYI